jgi:hypothetical protein
MTEKIYPYRKNIGLEQAFEIFTRHTETPLDELKPGRGAGEKPFFVLLYGPPGCGKSYTFAHLSEIIPSVDSSKAVSISLDALAESVGKFRNRSLEAYKAEDYETCETLYTSTIRGTYNNSLYNKSPGKPKKGEPTPEKFPALTELRLQALDESIRRGLNIIYERTAASTKSDIFEDEIFVKTRGRYNVYVIYPQVEKEELEARLAKRIHNMAKTKGFARYVPPELASDFLETHMAYMIQYLVPKLGTGDIDALYLVNPSKGTYERMTAEGKEAPQPIKKGGRRLTRRQKRSKSRKGKRRA